MAKKKPATEDKELTTVAEFVEELNRLHEAKFQDGIVARDAMQELIGLETETKILTMNLRMLLLHQERQRLES